VNRALDAINVSSYTPSKIMSSTCEPQLLQSHAVLGWGEEPKKAAGGRVDGDLYSYHFFLAVATRYALDIGSIWPVPTPTLSTISAAPLVYLVLQRTSLGHACSNGTDAFATGCVTSTLCNNRSSARAHTLPLRPAVFSEHKADRCLPMLDSGGGFVGGNARSNSLPKGGSHGANYAGAVRSADTTHTGRMVTPLTHSDSAPLPISAPRLAWQFSMLAPVHAPSGWTLLGELDKYNPVSSHRIKAVEWRSGSGPSHGSYRALGSPKSTFLTVQVHGAAHEEVMLYAVSPKGVVVVANGRIGEGGEGLLSFYGF
jgi:hypothetical protein